MKSLGQQRPMTDPDPVRPLDRVGSDPLADERRFHLSILDEQERYYTALGVLLEENVRGLIREWQAVG